MAREGKERDRERVDPLPNWKPEPLERPSRRPEERPERRERKKRELTPSR